jgi:PIN domain nuclease of toxin-antitoxin system
VLLFDTHAWIWSVEGDARRVGARARRLISQAEARDSLRLSAASLFEIVALHTAGRLRLAHPPEEWLELSVDRAGARIAEVTRRVAVDAGFITRAALPDPLDRLLVATARQLEATLLTADRTILDYAARTKQVRVHDLAR